MKIILLNNPKSGRGTGAGVVAELEGQLREAGHHPTRMSAGPELDQSTFRAAIRKADLLVIAGGDGTLHHALPAIVETGALFYHFPMGTENLFTREFGMDREPRTLLRAIERGRRRVCDAGFCNGRLFSLMVGVGFDACVVEQLAARRTGGTNRTEYVRHAASELLDPRSTRLTVRVDGRFTVENAYGMLLIANSRQYAARLDPARNADMSDGLLDVVFYPHRTSLGLLGWLAATAAGSHLEIEGIVNVQGKHIEVWTDTAAPIQIDGEAAGLTPALDARSGHGFDARVLPGVLHVLVP